MNLPKMILFDYGETLLSERNIDFLRGERVVFYYLQENPRQVTPEEVAAFGVEVFEAYGTCREKGFEIHEWPALRCKYEYFGLSFRIPLQEVEKILWTNASEGVLMPHIAELLDFLRENQIRVGVISNIGWSGEALSDRLHRYFPGYPFEFILASSEYAIRKPNPWLFAIALQKAGLSGEEVWYCGDRISADVCGAHGAGIFPVWYKDTEEVPPTVGFAYLHIRDWRELMAILQNIAKKQ